MRQLVREFRRNPAIRTVTAGIISELPRKAWFSEIETIFNAVRDNVRYTLDINEVETLQWPTVTMQKGYGDCDDMAVLLATMLESVGHPTRFVAVSLNGPDDYEHVFVETKAGGQNDWIGLDPTEDFPAGWQVPDQTYRMIMHNGS